MSTMQGAASAILLAIDEFKQEVDRLFDMEWLAHASRRPVASLTDRPVRSATGSNEQLAAERASVSFPMPPKRLVAAEGVPARAMTKAPLSGGEDAVDDPRRRLDALAKRLGDRARRSRPDGTSGSDSTVNSGSIVDR